MWVIENIHREKYTLHGETYLSYPHCGQNEILWLWAWWENDKTCSKLNKKMWLDCKNHLQFWQWLQASQTIKYIEKIIRLFDHKLTLMIIMDNIQSIPGFLPKIASPNLTHFVCPLLWATLSSSSHQILISSHGENGKHLLGTIPKGLNIAQKQWVLPLKQNVGQMKSIDL